MSTTYLRRRKRACIDTFYCLVLIAAPVTAFGFFTNHRNTNFTLLTDEQLQDTIPLTINTHGTNETNFTRTGRQSSSPPPPSLSPTTNKKKDDWYFSYKPKHPMKATPKNELDNLANDANVSIANSTADCLERYGTGRLGQIACRGMATKGKTVGDKGVGNDSKNTTTVKSVKSKAPKVKARMCGKGRRMKSCNDDLSAPSIVPSFSQSPSESTMNIPSLSPSRSPISKETTSPSVTIIPTITVIPSIFIPPTPYPTFDSTKSEPPSLPPNKMKPTNAPMTMNRPVVTNQPSSTPINNALLQRSTPFEIAYGIMNDDDFGIISNTTTSSMITNDVLMEVEKITINFLKDYLNEQFFGNTESIVDSFVSNIYGNNTLNTVLPSITYGFGIVFTHTTTFIPSQQEIDVLIESGFLVPFVDVLIGKLQQLNTSNIFYTTNYVEYSIRVDVTYDMNGRSNDKNLTQTASGNVDIGNNQTSPPVRIDDNINQTSSVKIDIDDNQTSAPIRIDENMTVSVKLDMDVVDNETSPPIRIDDNLDQTNSPEWIIENNKTSPPISIDNNNDSFDAMMLRYEASTVKVTPFSLSYQWNNTGLNHDLNPTIGETKVAANITLMFLDHYLHTMFDLIQPGIFTYFTGYSAGMIYKHNVIEYRTGLQFQNTSVFTSIQNEVDMIIQTAFIPKYIEPLLVQLHSSLPSTNPFSKTTSITFQFNIPAPTNNDKHQMSTLGIVAVVMVTLFILLSISYMIRYRYYRWYRTTRRHFANVPKIVIHTNYDPIHGDLIEIISSESNDDENDDDDHHISSKGGALSSVMSSVRQRLISPTTITTMKDDIEKSDDTNNSITSHEIQQQHSMSNHLSNTTPKSYSSDGWRSTTSSSIGSIGSIDAIPMKYSEPNIFVEGID
jgi:hypothetical protein